VANEQFCQTTRKILVKQSAHLRRVRRGLLQEPLSPVPGARTGIIQKNLQRVSRFQVIEERFDWNACASEHRSAAVDFGIDGYQLLIHDGTSECQPWLSIARPLFIDA